MEYPKYLSKSVIEHVEKNWPDKDNPEKRNWYICQSCHHTTATKHAVPGVTPFMHGCEKCDGTAYSSFYKPPYPEAVTIEPTQEWYRPDDDEFNAMPVEYRDHYFQGGLKTRKV